MKPLENENGGYVPIPEAYTRKQLNALYREIPLKDTASRTLRKTFNAMANLYGIIRMKKAYEIIARQSPSLVSEDEFLAFAEIARHEREDYYILGEDELFTDGKAGSPFDREIIDAALLNEDTGPYRQLRQMQRGKPYYIPPKKELLRYDDAFYGEETPEAEALRAFLFKCFKLSEARGSALFTDLQYRTRCMDTGSFDIIDWLEELGLSLENRSDLEQLAKLYQQFHNATRMRCNRGYTPHELFQMYPPDERMPKSLSFGPNIRRSIAEGTMKADELRKGVLAMDLPDEALRISILKNIADAEKGAEQPSKAPRVGRNDPCPCGSGKKYKRCCGR